MNDPAEIDGVSAGLASMRSALNQPDRKKRFNKLFPLLLRKRTRQIDGPALRVTNLVLQGGGMLGAAHVGFVYALERIGLRFGAVAGASAGSIVAMGLVCARGDRITNEVGDDLFRLVCSVPTDVFIDGPPRVRRLIKQFLLGRSVFTVGQASDVHYAWRRLVDRRGLNPGDEFENWLASTLARDFAIHTVDDLRDCLAAIGDQLGPLASVKRPEKVESPEQLLKLMATAVPIGMKLEFPSDLAFLDERYARQSPALLVRSSMSIPAFFEPVELRTRPGPWSEVVRKRYITLAEGGDREDLEKLESIYMLDGGVFSNLPLDAFAHMPRLPTIAVALVTRPPALKAMGRRSLRGMADDALGLLTSMKAQRDRDALASLEMNRPDDFDRFRLVGIDTGDHNWLNFMAGQEDLNDLFARGVKAAATFIENI